MTWRELFWVWFVATVVDLLVVLYLFTKLAY